MKTRTAESDRQLLVKRSSFAAGALRIVAVVGVGIGAIGFSSARPADPQTTPLSGTYIESIRLGSNSALVVDTWGVRSEYGSGDTIEIRWVDGIAFVGDQQIHPLPRTDKNHPVHVLKEMYGRVPLVQQFVERHAGEGLEEQVWNQAAEIWAARIQAAVREAGAYYSLLVTDNGNADKNLVHPDSAAVLVALALCNETDLVATAIGYGPPNRDDRDNSGYLYVKWKGRELQPEIVQLEPVPLNTLDSPE